MPSPPATPSPPDSPDTHTKSLIAPFVAPPAQSTAVSDALQAILNLGGASAMPSLEAVPEAEAEAEEQQHHHHHHLQQTDDASAPSPVTPPPPPMPRTVSWANPLEHFFAISSRPSPANSPASAMISGPAANPAPTPTITSAPPAPPAPPSTLAPVALPRPAPAPPILIVPEPPSNSTPMMVELMSDLGLVLPAAVNAAPVPAMPMPEPFAGDLSVGAASTPIVPIVDALAAGVLSAASVVAGVAGGETMPHGPSESGDKKRKERGFEEGGALVSAPPAAKRRELRGRKPAAVQSAGQEDAGAAAGQGQTRQGAGEPRDVEMGEGVLNDEEEDESDGDGGDEKQSQ